MDYLTKRIIQVVVAIISILTLLLIVQIDTLVFNCTEFFSPGLGPVVCIVLVSCEIVALFFLYKAFFGRPSRLILRVNASEDERAAFKREMLQRLRQNKHIVALNLDPHDSTFLEQALAHLDTLADKEIRSHAKKIFLGTALAQNGRLDALIMFFALVRLVWRVSKIYNQKPTPVEMWSVFSTVSTSTFIAFSIEALDIPQKISEVMGELMPTIAPTMAASSVPFVGSALHVFTGSLING